LSYKNVDVIYIRKTKRKLKTRISEHRRDINKKIDKHFVITEYRLNNNHEIN